MYVWSGLGLLKAALLVARGVACEERPSENQNLHLVRAGQLIHPLIIIIGVLEQEKKY